MDRLAQICPRWRNFTIKPHGKYLGVWLGPSAGTMQWRDQYVKWRGRVSALSSLGLAASEAALLYNSRCVSVLSYIVQFKSVPKFVKDTEPAMLAKVFRLPGQTLRLRDFVALPAVGLRSMTSRALPSIDDSQCVKPSHRMVSVAARIADTCS